jgi:rubrerythrin
MATKFFFNDLEAFKIAIDIEKSGERFYIKAANRIEEAGIKNMLLELAHQEREHADTFERLYNWTAKEKDELDDTYLFEPEISQYLAAMVQTAIFPSEEKQDEILANIKDVEDVLRIGIQAEKDSILFYTEMIIYSKLVDAKEAFRKLLKEEKKHLIDLQTALNSLRAKG